MTNRNLSVSIKIAIAAVAWVALGLQLYILVSNTPANGMTFLQALGRFFLFFTILSNLLAAISITLPWVIPHSWIGRFLSKPSQISAIAVYIFIVGLVYNTVLRKLWQPRGLQQIADELLHVAVPVLFTVYWIFFVSKGTLKWKHAIAWLLFPFIYLIYAIARGSIEGFYPYPFLDLHKLTYTHLMLNCIGLTAAFLVTGLVFIAVDKAMASKSAIRY